jgi:hypothetical protein
MAVLLWSGSQFYLFSRDSRRAITVPFGDTIPKAAEIIDSGFERGLPGPLEDRFRALGGEALQIPDPSLAQVVARKGLRLAPVQIGEIRAARERIPVSAIGRHRELTLALAQRRLVRVLSSPEESLITLAREEERIERALGRETGASAHWIEGPSAALQEYSERWTQFRLAFERHHLDLLRDVESAARRYVPNLSRVTGERVAGRLVAAAGGLGALSRMTAAKLQLLGARRRPSAGRGPRFGILYRGLGVSEVPPARQGAYARSLSALAIIAARADATTHADVATRLIVRRDRRMHQLQSGR